MRRGALVAGLSLALVTGCGSSSSAPTGSTPGGVGSRSNGSAAPRVADWLTYMGGPTRTGETELPRPHGPLRIAWRTPALDGPTYAEPLVSDGEVIVATQHNTVYALAPADGHILWSAHLGEPDDDLGPRCVVHTLGGLTSTPVIDAASHTIFAVTFVRPGEHRLVALDSRSGAVRFNRVVDPPGENPLLEGQRGALALVNGTVYIPFGGRFGDCGRYHGAVIGVRSDGAGPLLQFRVRAAQGAGVWSPTGVVAEPDGNLLVTTGNTWGAAAFGPFNDSNAVIRLSPQLRELDYWAPGDWQQRSASDVDQDVGSMGPVLVKGDRIFQATKHGSSFLLHRSPLGHIGAEIAAAPVATDAIGSAAYSSAAQLILVPTTNGTDALRLGAGAALTPAWSALRGTFEGPPLVGGGTAWMVDVTGALHVLALADGRELATLKLGGVVHFATPTPLGKLVLVATDAGVAAVAA